jgi:RNA polymerase sigma-70 factor (ECF subfamily)
MSADESSHPDQLSGPRRVVPDETEDDKRVVRKVRSGDVDAFEILVRRYEKPVYHAVRRLVRDPEDARDVAQTAFVKAFRQLDSFDERHRFFSWLYRIAVHEGLNHLRGRGREEPIHDDHAASGPGPMETLESVEIGRLVEAAMTRLTPEHRAVILLRHFGDCSYHDIAATLDIPEKTVRSRLFDARRSLRTILSTLGVDR